MYYSSKGTVDVPGNKPMIVIEGLNFRYQDDLNSSFTGKIRESTLDSIVNLVSNEKEKDIELINHDYLTGYVQSLSLDYGNLKFRYKNLNEKDEFISRVLFLLNQYIPNQYEKLYKFESYIQPIEISSKNSITIDLSELNPNEKKTYDILVKDNSSIFINDDVYMVSKSICIEGFNPCDCSMFFAKNQTNEYIIFTKYFSEDEILFYFDDDKVIHVNSLIGFGDEFTIYKLTTELKEKLFSNNIIAIKYSRKENQFYLHRDFKNNSDLDFVKFTKDFFE